MRDVLEKGKPSIQATLFMTGRRSSSYDLHRRLPTSTGFLLHADGPAQSNGALDNHA